MAGLFYTSGFMQPQRAIPGTGNGFGSRKTISDR